MHRKSPSSVWFTTIDYLNYPKQLLFNSTTFSILKGRRWPCPIVHKNWIEVTASIIFYCFCICLSICVVWTLRVLASFFFFMYEQQTTDILTHFWVSLLTVLNKPTSLKICSKFMSYNYQGILCSSQGVFISKSSAMNFSPTFMILKLWFLTVLFPNPMTFFLRCRDPKSPEYGCMEVLCSSKKTS